MLQNSLNDVLFDINKTAIEQYITILEIQLATMPKNNEVSKVIIACKELAEEINILYKIKNN